MSSTEPAAAKDNKKQDNKKLFIAKTAAVGDGLAIRPGEVAVEGAEILRTHGHLFKPLEITYHA